MRSKIAISLIAIAAILATHPPCIEGNQNDTQDAHHWKSTRFRGSNLENGRFRKASGDDNLKTSVSNLQMVARITNAIYLQQGLISGSIPADALISELLHFGSVKPSDIATIDIAKIQAAVNALKDLPNKLQPNVDAVEAEKTLAAIDGVVKHIGGSGNIKSWNRTKMEKEITTLAKGGVSPTKITQLKAKISTIQSSMSGLSADTPNNPVPETKSSTYFADLVDNLESLKTASSALDGVYWSADGFSNVTEMIRPIAQARNAVEHYSQNALFFAKNRGKAYVDYFGSLLTSTKSVDEVATYLDVFKNLLAARRTDSSNQKDLVFTAGFPNGLSDLIKLHQNLQDAWIRKIVNSTRLSTALEKLKGLEAPMQSIEDVLSSQEVLDHSTAITSLIDNVHQLKSNEGKLKAGIAEVQNCNQPANQNLPVHSHLQSYEDHLKSIDNILVEMTTKTIALVEYLETPEIGQFCDDVIKISKKAKDIKNIKSVMTEFKNYNNHQNFLNHIMEIERKINAVIDVQKATSIQTEAKSAEALFPELKAYHQATNHYAAYFSCLQKDGVSDMLDIVQKMKLLRTDDPSRVTSINNGMEAIKKIAGSKDNLRKLETTISAQKSFKSIETDGLTLLKDGSSHSKTIGLAVQGVSNMEHALEKRPDLERLLKAKDLIQKLEKRWKDSEDVSNLGSLLSLLDQIQKMIDSLDNFKKSITPSSSTTLADHSEIFQKAKSVSGASGEFEKIAGTVGKLKESVTDAAEKTTLGDVESTLKTMDTMGLDFVKFQKSFDESKGSLSALDTFFTSFADQVEREIKSQHEAESFNLLLVAALVGFVTVLLVSGVLYWIHHYYIYIWWKIFGCCRKKLSDEDYLLMVLRHFHKGITDHADGNQKNWSEEEKKSNSPYVHYFDTHYQADNGATQVDHNKCEKANTMECLSNEPLLSATRVKVRGLESNYYHASFLRLLNGVKWILCQTPLHGFGTNFPRNSTARAFWYMVSQQKSKRIFMLNPLTYGGAGRLVYSAYFPQSKGTTLAFEDVKVTCTKIRQVTKDDRDFKLLQRMAECPEGIEIRQLSVTIGDRKPFTVTHYWVRWWSTGTIPVSTLFVVDLIRVIMDGTDDIGPPVVHCGDGISETGLVAFVAYCITMVLVERKIDFLKCLQGVRRYRADCLQNRWTYSLAANVLVEYFRKMIKNPINNEEIIEKYTFISDSFFDLMHRAQVAVPHRLVNAVAVDNETAPTGSKTSSAVEPGKTETGKTETGKTEAGKKEAGKKEAGKKEAGKKEAGKPKDVVPSKETIQDTLDGMKKEKKESVYPTVDPMSGIKDWEPRGDTESEYELAQIPDLSSKSGKSKRGKSKRNYTQQELNMVAKQTIEDIRKEDEEIRRKAAEIKAAKAAKKAAEDAVDETENQ